MKKTAFLFALTVGYWFIFHNAIAYNLDVDSRMNDISSAQDQTPNPNDYKSVFTGLAGEPFWNGECNIDLTGNEPTYQSDNLFGVNDQIPENHELDGTSKATSAPEPTTMFLFGIGLVLLAGSGRKIKKRVSVNRNTLNSPFLILKKSSPNS